MVKMAKALLLCVLFVCSVSVYPLTTDILREETYDVMHTTQEEEDSDGDGFTDGEETRCNTDIGDAASYPKDTDGDGVCDHLDAFPEDSDESSDFDNDGIGDNSDTDNDNDRVDDVSDDFPLDPCRTTDTDADGLADFIIYRLCDEENPVADDDDDNDGVNDLFDAFPLDPCGHTDTDGDGLPNDLFTSINYPCRGMEGDPDDDNDGHLDDDDVFPLDPTEWADFDLDGIGNNADVNDDNDGWSDLMEFVCGTDPYDNNDYPTDTDGDGYCDTIDPDDDNDGVLDIDDDDPLAAPGSWEWSFSAGDMVRINDVAPDGDGNFLVTGAYTGNSTIGSFQLTGHNSRDAFVAKIDQQGDVLWATTTTMTKKLCANDYRSTGVGSTSSVSVSLSDPFVATEVAVAVNTTATQSSLASAWPAGSNTIQVMQNDPNDPNPPLTYPNPVGIIDVGDLLYTDQSWPYTFLGVVQSVSPTEIVLDAPFSEPLEFLSRLYVLDENTFSYSSSISIPINQGQFERVRWAESYAEANAIVVDDDGDAYITGNFAGYIKFEKSGVNKIIKSYNVRPEGDWLRERFMHTSGIYLDQATPYGISDPWPNSLEVRHIMNGVPCGAPISDALHGSDMFVAKIDSNGVWQWVEEAGTADSDTGDAITLDTSQEHVWVAGNLRQSWCDHNWAYYDDEEGQRTMGGCLNTDFERQNNPEGTKLGRNSQCTPNRHVEYKIFLGDYNGYSINSHAGMFNGIDGAPELHGCGAYIAKIKASNGNWKHAEELSAPIGQISKDGDTIVQGIDSTEYPCIATTSLWVGDNYDQYVTTPSCSDMYVQITELEMAGNPERLFVSGVFADRLVLDDDDEWNVQTGVFSGYTGNGQRAPYIPEETGFVAKFNPTTKNWQTLSGTWGDGDDVHDLVTDGSYYYYISGCSGDSNYLRKYDFSGQLEWARTFGNECRHTTLTIDGLYDIYVSGTFSTENGYRLTLGDIKLPQPYSLAMDSGYASFDVSHFVAKIDSGGNWIWAEESPHLMGYGAGHHSVEQYKGCRCASPWAGIAPNKYISLEKPLGGVGSSTPTGMFVDNGRVYMVGLVNGAGVFKDDIHSGSTSYWAAIDGPLAYDPPTSTPPIGGGVWDISFLPASMTILTLAFAAVVVQRRLEDEATSTDLSDFSERTPFVEHE